MKVLILLSILFASMGASAEWTCSLHAKEAAYNPVLSRALIKRWEQFLGEFENSDVVAEVEITVNECKWIGSTKCEANDPRLTKLMASFRLCYLPDDGYEAACLASAEENPGFYDPCYEDENF